MFMDQVFQEAAQKLMADPEAKKRIEEAMQAAFVEAVPKHAQKSGDVLAEEGVRSVRYSMERKEYVEPIVKKWMESTRPAFEASVIAACEKLASNESFFAECVKPYLVRQMAEMADVAVMQAMSKRARKEKAAAAKLARQEYVSRGKVPA